MIELKTYKMVDEKYCTDCVCVIPSEVYLKSEVDAFITELKDEIKRKEGVEIRWFERCIEARTENRKLKRALWIARAKIAKAMKAVDNLDNYLSLHKNSKWFGIYATRIDTWYYKWDNVERKCLKKAEEYK